MTDIPVFGDLPRLLLALGLLGVFLIRIPNAVRDYSTGAVAKFPRLLDRVVIFVLMPVFSIVIPLTWIFSSAFAAADIERPAWTIVPGVLLMITGLALLRRSHADLGRNYCGRLEIIRGAELVTTGIYRHARHPMYLAVLLFALGQAVLVPNGIAGPSMLVSWMLIHLVRVPREEAMMEDYYGDAWRAYVTRSNRYWPFSRP